MFGDQGKGKDASFVYTKICANFPNCNYGAKCTFAHGDQELGQPLRAMGQAPKGIVGVGPSAKGSKGAGPKGKRKPSGGPGGPGGPWAGAACQKGKGKGKGPVKTKMCTNHPNCAFGDRCTFAHGPHEIGQPQPADGAEPGEKRRRLEDDAITPAQRLQLFRKSVIDTLTEQGGSMPLKTLVQADAVMKHKRGSCTYLDVLRLFPSNFNVEKMEKKDGEFGLFNIVLQSDDMSVPIEHPRGAPDASPAAQQQKGKGGAKVVQDMEISEQRLRAFRAAVIRVLTSKGGLVMLKELAHTPDVARIIFDKGQKLPLLQWLKKLPQDFYAENTGEGFNVFLLSTVATLAPLEDAQEEEEEVVAPDVDWDAIMDAAPSN